MGVNNRRRRAAKRRTQHHSGRGAPGAGSCGGHESFGSGRDEPWPSEAVAQAALLARMEGDTEVFEQLVSTLARRADGERAVLDLLVGFVDDLFAHGWEPHEVPLGAARVASSRGPALALAGLAVWASRDRGATQERVAAVREVVGPEPWPGDRGWLRRAFGPPELSGDDTDASVHAGLLRDALVVLRDLHRLPRLLPIGPDGAAPFAVPAGLDERILAKVRSLLAKAESTNFPEEAEALSAKAQELIARHALDAAAIQVTEEGSCRYRPEKRRVWFDRPYVDGKSYLLQQVAEVNRCRAAFDDRLEYSLLVGFAADLDAIEMLFTSLLVQSTRAMLAEGSQRDQWGRSRTRAFRSSFMVGFAIRIGERLRVATDTAGDTAGEQIREAALPVLARRAEEVDETIAEVFPHVYRRVGAGHRGGYLAGQLAADRAHLASAVLRGGCSA